MLPSGSILDPAVENKTLPVGRPSTEGRNGEGRFGRWGSILIELWRKGAGSEENLSAVHLELIGGLPGNTEAAGRGHMGTQLSVLTRPSGV